MPSVVTYFDPQPAVAELPTVFASPFGHTPPHPLARRAADELATMLRAGAFAVSVAELDARGGGKMFGVLVVADREGRIGYLRAFSGMLAGQWELPGFAPPLFDAAVRDVMWPAGQAELRAHELALRALDTSPELAAARAELTALDARVAEELAALDATHRVRRARRRIERDRLEANRAAAARAARDLEATRGADPRDEADRAAHVHAAADLEANGAADAGAAAFGDGNRTDAEVAARLHALDQESRGDAAERKRLEAARAETRGPLAERVATFERERTRLERLRADESRDLMKQVHDTYMITSARGERRALRDLFASGEPPAGAGDCAGPKLLGEAYRLGLRPLALAEVWWGAPPATGGRHAGVFYPSCRGKCGPILPHMLDGLAVAEPPVFGGGPIATAQPPVVFEDEWIVVVDKPVGLLSVPGRSGALRDSVQTRLRARYPEASGPLVVHRLDLDTSGLLLAAKDLATYAALQAQFARREIDKRYIAWLDGVVAADAGVVDLPIRVDLDDRPRQIHDPLHGKAAITEWSVLERGPRATRVALIPKTGRTHQLRVHAAHPRGIGVPIVGDRLYGRSHAEPVVAADQGIETPHPRADEPRLMLHAERLAFVHPHTGERIELERAAPF